MMKVTTNYELLKAIQNNMFSVKNPADLRLWYDYSARKLYFNNVTGKNEGKIDTNQLYIT